MNRTVMKSVKGRLRADGLLATPGPSRVFGDCRRVARGARLTSRQILEGLHDWPMDDADWRQNVIGRGSL